MWSDRKNEAAQGSPCWHSLTYRHVCGAIRIAHMARTGEDRACSCSVRPVREVGRAEGAAGFAQSTLALGLRT